MDSGFVPIPIICIFLLGKMRPLILRNISEQCLLIPIILLLLLIVVVVVYVCCLLGVCVCMFPLFKKFTCLRLFIPSVFMAVVNILMLEFSF